MLKDKGFSLVEIIVVLAILGVISAIAAPNVVRYIDNSREATCTADRATIIRQFWAAKAYNNSITLEEVLANTDNIYLSKSNSCPSGGTYSISGDAVSGYSIACSVHTNDVSVTITNTNFAYDFNLIQDINDIPGGSIQVGDWEISNDGNKYVLHNTRNGENRILFKNSNDEYIIDTSVQLSSTKGKNNGNGYGVIFEATTTQDGNDDGYIFQLNKNSNSGTLSIRQRENGQDNDPIITMDPSQVITNFDESWWDNNHDIKIKVSKVNDTTKTVSIFIDNEEITSNIDPSSLQIASVSIDENYIGYRTWGNSQADIESVSVSEL